MWDLFSPAVGAAEATVAGLIAEMGDDPFRFATYDGLQAFAGTAPTDNSSGSLGRPVRRDVRGNGLHQALWHWAGTAKVRSPGAMTYYWSFREAGSANPHAMRKLMNRLTRHVHHCLVTGTVWDESKVWPHALPLNEAKAYRDECKGRAAAWQAAHPRKGKKDRTPMPRRPRKAPPQAARARPSADAA